METLAYARQLGITSPQAIDQLTTAVDAAARQYAEFIGPRLTPMRIDGEIIGDSDALALPAPDGSAGDGPAIAGELPRTDE